MTMNEPFDSLHEGPVPHEDLGGYILGSLTSEERTRFEADVARDPALRSEVDKLADLPRLLGLAALVDDEDDVVVPTRPVQAMQSTLIKRSLPLLAVAAAVLLLVGAGAGFLATRPGSARIDKQVAFALADPAGAPAARGTAALSRKPGGVGVRLQMRGLPPTEPGSRYECWWVGKNGKVSAGSFQVGNNGVVDVQLNVAGSLDGPFRININNVSGSTETRVLTAEVV